jgi:transporter family-2 protein
MRLDLLAALSGVMIAMQTRANGELSIRLDNGLQAAFISFSTGWILIAAISLFNPGIKSGIKNLGRAVRAKEIAPGILFAGVLGGTFTATQTQIVPFLGVALYSVASIAGQSGTSLVVDRIGLTGGGKKPISPRRITAAVVTVMAVLISVLDRIEAKNLSLIAVGFAVFAGIVVGVQRALNGLINEHSHQSFTTSLLNFTTGTAALGIVLLIAIAIGKVDLAPLPSGPWWIYTGGTIGVIYIAFTARIVQHLGVLTFTLFSTGGTLFGALIIDLYSPTKGISVSTYLISGIIMTFVGVLVGGVNSSKPLKR